MDDDFINSLYESTKIKVELEEIKSIKIAEDEKNIGKYLYQNAKKYAQDLNIPAFSLFEKAISSKNNPRGLHGLIFPEMPRKYFTVTDEVAVHIGLLLVSAYGGYAEAANVFINIASQFNIGINYISKDEFDHMRMASQLYSLASNHVTNICNTYIKYETGTQKNAEILLSKLHHGIKKSDPDAFFSLALASIQGIGTDKNLEKAFKLLTIAAGLGHVKSKNLRQQMSAKFPELNIVSNVDTKTLEISSKNNSNPATINTYSVNEKKSISVKLNEKIQSNIELVNSEKIFLAMMKDAPYCTIISAGDGTATEWLTSLPWDCHLLYEGVFERENNTVERCLRLLESNGYPAKTGELCSAPPLVAIESLLIATYQLGLQK